MSLDGRRQKIGDLPAISDAAIHHDGRQIVYVQPERVPAPKAIRALDRIVPASGSAR